MALIMTATQAKRLVSTANGATKRVRKASVAVPVQKVGIIGSKRLILPHPPTMNHRLMLVNGRMVKTRVSRDYADAVALEARKVFAEPVTCRVVVSIIVHPRNNNYADIDNITKTAFDAMTGVAWRDDSLVWRLTVERSHVVKGGQLDMTIWEYVP